MIPAGLTRTDLSLVISGYVNRDIRRVCWLACSLCRVQFRGRVGLRGRFYRLGDRVSDRSLRRMRLILLVTFRLDSGWVRMPWRVRQRGR